MQEGRLAVMSPMSHLQAILCHREQPADAALHGFDAVGSVMDKGFVR